MGNCRVKVHLRLRPSTRPSTFIHVDNVTSTVRIDVQKVHGGGPPRPFIEQMAFPLDGIIQSSSQELVFEQCARQVVEDVLLGYNGTILAYGQTGSGKTFTMTGDTKAYVHRGVVPRAVERIFAEKVAKPEAGIVVHVSYLEVYNEGVYDLLPQKRIGSAVNLVATEENGITEIKGLNKMHCNTEEEAMRYFFEGERHRSIAPHALNQMSSRSHCIFTMYIERHSGLRTLQEVTSSKLNLVDLAGSERLKRTDVAGQTKKEAMNINKSLTLLEQAVVALRQGCGHVPFRQSRLTTLLKDALGGNCKTVLIVCAWFEDFFLDETISTLRFAQRVKYLKTSAIINKKADAANNQRKYIREIAELKQELALRDALNGRQNLSYDELTEESRGELRERIQAFLSEEAGIDTIPIENFKQVKELFCLFKEAQVSLRGELEKSLRDYCGRPETYLNHPVHDVDIEPGSVEANDEECVGVLGDEGFHVGHIAPDDARPDRPDSPQAVIRTSRSPGIKYGEDCLLDYKKSPTSQDPPLLLWDLAQDSRNEAFLEYKHGTEEGSQLDFFLRGKTNELRMKKETARDLCTMVNSAKAEIQDIKKMLVTECKEGHMEFGKDQNEKKFQVLHRFKVVRSAYKKAFDELKGVKIDLEFLQQEIRDCKQKMVESFYRWFETVHGVKGNNQQQMKGWTLPVESTH
ncbi:unnamed protein product [Calypogeia fissa]